MIYLFLGPHKKTHPKANLLISALLKKQPDANFTKINTENFLNYQLENMIASQGLFFSKNVFTFTKVFENSDFKEQVLKKISELKQTENIFIFLEEELDKKSFDKFQKYAEKIQECKEENEKLKTEFNIFSLTDSFAKRDKKNLWLSYLEALKKKTPEEIYGVLWWQIKTLLIVKKSKNLEESGLKSFMYSKAKNSLNNFKEGELEEIAFDLIKQYHNSRRNGVGLEIVLERWVLAN